MRHMTLFVPLCISWIHFSAFSQISVRELNDASDEQSQFDRIVTSLEPSRQDRFPDDVTIQEVKQERDIENHPEVKKFEEMVVRVRNRELGLKDAPAIDEHELRIMNQGQIPDNR